MNRFTPGIPVALLLSAWSITALADEAPRAVAQPASTSSAASTTPAKATAPTAPASSDASVRRLVCLNMSLQCFAIKPKSDDPSAKAQAASLDLKAPDIRRLVSEVELRQPVEEPTEIEQTQVQVEGSRPEVYVPGGIASLPWAVMHPTQAWRIFLPVPAAQAK